MKLKSQMRFAQISAERVNAETRIVELSFSSEAPVERTFGTEILDHSPTAARLGRLLSNAPLLFNHRMDDVVGVVESASIGKDRRGHATVRFARTQRADEILGMVRDRILPNVSFAYRIHAAVEDQAAGEIRVTDWEPLEISIVTVPADHTVGVGRGFTDEEIEVRIERASAPAAMPAATLPAKEIKMADDKNAAAGEGAESVKNDGTLMERARVKAIDALCRQHKIDDKTRVEWIDKGMTADQAAHQVLEIIAERTRHAPQSAAKLDMPKSDLRKYSLTRAINAAFDKDWSKADVELEAHQEIAKRMGTISHPNKFYVPLDVQERDQVQKRDLTAATGSAGGYLVQTNNVSFIELLRNRSVLFAMGARRLSGLQGNVTVPRHSGAATAYWLTNEATQITESQQTFGQLSLSPKTVGAYTEVSRQLTLQSSPDAESLVMSDLAEVVALAVDLAGLNGSGSGGQPTGIINTGSIGSVTGTSIAYAGILEFQSDVAGGNALSAGCGYVTTPAVAALLAQRVKVSSTYSPLWEGSLLDGQMAGFRAMASNQMPSANMLFGDFSQVIVAEWGVLEVEVNPYANFQAGIIGIRAAYTVDIGVRYAAAFSLATSIT